MCTRARARMRLTCTLLVLCSCARAGPLCDEPGAVRLAGATEPLCLDTDSGGASRLRLARCDARRPTQWWVGAPQQQLVQADTLAGRHRRGSTPLGLCVVSDGGTGATRACPAAPRRATALRSYVEHDVQGRLVLRSNNAGGCLGPAAFTAGGGEAAPVLAAPCDDASARWEFPSCADPPPLLSHLRNVALHKPVVMSSSGGGPGGDGAAVVNGWPEEHGWTNEGCPGVHSSERADERFPWLTVDLGATHVIHTVQIWNRGPCLPYSTYLCQARLWTFAIFVGDVPPPRPFPEQGEYPVNAPCARQERGQPLGTFANVACAATGRYVTLQQTGSLDAEIPGVLNICQLRVFGEAVTSPPPEAPAPAPPVPTLGAARRAARLVTRALRRVRATLLSIVTLLAVLTILTVLARRQTVACVLLRRRLSMLARGETEDRVL